MTRIMFAMTWLMLAAAPAAEATEVIAYFGDGTSVTGELVKYKYERFYWVAPAGEKAVKIRWDAVVSIRAIDPDVQLDLGGPESDMVGSGLPGDAKRSKQPMAEVEATAVAYEHALAAELAGWTRPDSFWVSRADAGALAVSALPPEAVLVLSTPELIGTDFLWSGEMGIEEGKGEWYDQRRERLVIEVSPGPFVSVNPYVEKSARRYYAGTVEPIWKIDKEPLELNLRTALSELEAGTLAETAMILAPSEAMRLAKQHAPEGFEFEVVDDSVVATRRVSEARGNPRTGEWARWERVLTVTMTLSGSGSEKRLVLDSREQERIVTGDREPEFSDSLTVDPRPAAMLLRGLLKSAGVRARAPSGLLEPVGLFEERTSQPDPVPALRSWETVRAEQQAESVATSTGTWRLSGPVVRVPETRADRSTWDEVTEEDGAAPDLSVRIDIAGDVVDLPTQADTPEFAWSWSSEVVFRDGRPEVTVTIADEDGESREVVGFCDLSIDGLLADEWVSCGKASIRLSPEWTNPAPDKAAEGLELP